MSELLPSTYLVFDTETNGFVPDDKLFVLQYGYLYVKDGAEAGHGATTLRMPPDEVLDEGAVNVHGLTREVLATQGVDPETATKAMHRLMESVMSEGGYFVGHNIQYDIKAVSRMFKRYKLPLIDIPGYGRMMDTGLIYKANKCDCRRYKGEDLWKYYSRVGGLRIKGLKWNLDAALEEFKLSMEKRGNHDAGEDCRLTNVLLQHMMKQAWAEKLLAGK